IVGLVLSLWQNAEARAKAVQNLQAAEQRKEAAEKQTAEQLRLADQKRAEVERLEKITQQEQLNVRRAVYTADMHFAHAAWETGNVARMVGLLERYAQPQAVPDLRNFEWHYLWRLAHNNRLTVPVERMHLIAQGIAALGLASPIAASLVVPQSSIPLGVAGN